MGRIECFRDLDSEAQQFIGGQGPAGDSVFEITAFQQFHDEQRLAVKLHDIVDRANVRMIQRGGGACLASKAFEVSRIAGTHVTQEFHGDVTAESHIFGAIDNTHTAGTKRRFNLIGSDRQAGKRRTAGFRAVECVDRE